MTKGVWRTVGGRRIFIKDGEDLSTAMINSGKFKSNKNQIINKIPKDMNNVEYNKLTDKINKETSKYKGLYTTVSEKGELFRENKEFNYSTGKIETKKMEVKYLYRAVSEKDYNNIKKNGYIKSDGSKNLSIENKMGLTVYKDSNPMSYLPNDGGYVLKIKIKPSNNFYYDKNDDYAKTSAKIFNSQIIEVNGIKFTNK